MTPGEVLRMLASLERVEGLLETLIVAVSGRESGRNGQVQAPILRRPVRQAPSQEWRRPTGS